MFHEQSALLSMAQSSIEISVVIAGPLRKEMHLRSLSTWFES